MQQCHQHYSGDEYENAKYSNNGCKVNYTMTTTENTAMMASATIMPTTKTPSIYNASNYNHCHYCIDNRDNHNIKEDKNEDDRGSTSSTTLIQSTTTTNTTLQGQKNKRLQLKHRQMRQTERQQLRRLK